MDKSSKKRNNYNADILNAVAIRYGVTVDYVRKCLTDVRKGIVPDNIKSEYHSGVNRLNAVVSQTIEKIKNK